MAAKGYHHGNLEAALVEAALVTLRTEGAEALTLRGVGAKVGVSRTALYRHFADKAALMARVAAEGFRLLAAALASVSGGPLGDMGEAYVRFALENEGHYRAMFGRVANEWCHYPELLEDGGRAFGVLLDAVVHGQAQGRLVQGDPVGMARVLWASMHGVAMLTMDGHLSVEDGVTALAAGYLKTGIGTP